MLCQFADSTEMLAGESGPAMLPVMPRALAWFRRLLLALFLCTSICPAATGPVDYDIVYVRQPRFGDNSNTTWPEVFHPARLDPGADLMLLHPDGTEEVLVAGGNGGVTDPFISFDGKSCYYVLFPDLRSSHVIGRWLGGSAGSCVQFRGPPGRPEPIHRINRGHSARIQFRGAGQVLDCPLR